LGREEVTRDGGRNGDEEHRQQVVNCIEHAHSGGNAWSLYRFLMGKLHKLHMGPAGFFSSLPRCWLVFGRRNIPISGPSFLPFFLASLCFHFFFLPAFMSLPSFLLPCFLPSFLL
jgi:hypothetical protein